MGALAIALRMVAKKPAVAFTVVAVLALTIGANTAIFSVVSAVLIRPLPYSDPDKIVIVWETDLSQRITRGIVSPADFLDLKEQSRSFKYLSPWRFWYFNLTGTDEPQRVQGLQVGASFFELLGVAPELGRGFDAENEQPGFDKVVILSHRLWQNRFAGDPGVIGRMVPIDAESYKIVGVLPESFRFMRVLNHELDIWVPLPIERARVSRADHSINVFGRLNPGVSVAEAQAELDSIMSRVAVDYPDTNTGRGARVVTLQDSYGWRVHHTLVLLLAAVGFVLLAACANIANLLLARALDRRKEMAIRTALGAGRGRLFLQMLTESLLLAVAGGLLGLLLACCIISLLNNLIPNSVVPRVDSFSLDVGVFAYAATISILTGVLFGIAPGLLAWRKDLVVSLNEGARGSVGPRAGKLRNALAGIEVGLAVMLLIGAVLMIRSSIILQTFDRGFQTRDVLTGQIWLPRAKYPQAARLTQFYRQVLDSLGSTPGVDQVSMINFLPLAVLSDTVTFQIEGRPAPQQNRQPSALYYVVGPEYFQTMRMALLRGRDITTRDAEGTNGVTVINQTMAERYWPDGDPIGQVIKPEFPKSEAPWRPVSNAGSLAIIGVVRDAREDGVMSGPTPQMYVSCFQNPTLLTNFVVRSTSDTGQVAGVLRAAVSRADRDQPVYNIRTMDEAAAEGFAQPRILSAMLGGFALLALLLAVVGIYSMVAYTVSQRTYEIGVRMALGAARANILRLVLKSVAQVASGGVAAGLLGSVLASRIISGFLFGVSSTDSGTFIGVSAFLAAVAMVAAYGPARRAAQIDPMISLRRE
ncbi:MAG TPA: ABC transporter permease [Blastocatellia bacterium]